MAVDKFSGTAAFPNFLAILSSRKSLENTLAQFEEQVAIHPPDVIRKRLRKRLSDIRININGDDEV
jgi:hypothetical protein